MWNILLMVPSSRWYKLHRSRQLNCRSLRCSWSIACQRCSNCIFILNLTPGFKGLGKNDFRTRWESFQFWDLVRLILQTLRLTHYKQQWVKFNKVLNSYTCMDHSGYGISQWETTLHWNIVSHWLSPYPEKAACITPSHTDKLCEYLSVT